eukprot:XP_022275130.1 uncharacterized protein LOC102155027 [Canis lupus familiaris]
MAPRGTRAERGSAGRGHQRRRCSGLRLAAAGWPGSAGREGERRRRGSWSAGAEVRGGAAAGGAPGPRAPHPSPGLQRAAGAGGGRPTGRRPRPQADFTLETSNAGPTGEPRGEVPGGTRQLTPGSPAQVHLGHLACTGVGPGPTESSLFSHSPEGRLAGSQVVDGRNQLPGVHPSALTSGESPAVPIHHQGSIWAGPGSLCRGSGAPCGFQKGHPRRLSVRSRTPESVQQLELSPGEESCTRSLKRRGGRARSLGAVGCSAGSCP